MTWELCDLSQTVLANLIDRKPSAKVDIARHVARSGQVQLSLDDPALPLVSVGDTVLRCTLPGWTDPLFVGKVSQLQDAYDQSGQVVATVNALDPLAQLAREVVMFWDAFSGYYTWTAYTGVNQALILWQIVNLAAGRGVGIIQGATPGAPALTMTLPVGTTLADAIMSVCQRFDAVEFELTPSAAGGGTLAVLNVYYPRQGSDKSATLKLQLGVDDTDNLTALSYTQSLDGMINRANVIGDAAGIYTTGGIDYPTHSVYRAEHAASIAQYGVWESSESLAGVTDNSVLQAVAKATVAANALPLDEFAVTLDQDAPIEFSPDGDFWIGDTVALQAELPQETLSANGRVSGASFIEMVTGDVGVAVSCEPDEHSGVTGVLQGAIIDAGDGSASPPPPAPEAVDTGMDALAAWNAQQINNYLISIGQPPAAPTPWPGDGN